MTLFDPKDTVDASDAIETAMTLAEAQQRDYAVMSDLRVVPLAYAKGRGFKIEVVRYTGNRR